MSGYFWRVTKDHTTDEGEPRRLVRGPGNADESLATNPSQWACYDDDGHCTHEGMIYGEYSGFEPLDDWCMADAGATGIKYEGEWL